MQRVSSFSSGTAYESFERLWTAGFKVKRPLMRRRPFWEGPQKSTELDFPVKFCWNLSHRANVKIILCQETAETVLWWQVMIGQGRLSKRLCVIEVIWIWRTLWRSWSKIKLFKKENWPDSDEIWLKLNWKNTQSGGKGQVYLKRNGVCIFMFCSMKTRPLSLLSLISALLNMF